MTAKLLKYKPTYSSLVQQARISVFNCFSVPKHQKFEREKDGGLVWTVNENPLPLRVTLLIYSAGHIS